MAPGTEAGQAVIGWDIGGAHLKAALVVDGRVVDVVQEPCRLWQGLDRLDVAFASIYARIGRAAVNAVTMTGELSDVFESRAAGVTALAGRAARRLGSVAVYAGAEGFLDPDAAAAKPDAVASANWHATAAVVARVLGDALVIDVGSTTTDIVPVRHGRLVARGATDAARMQTGELVYTGATRTPLMAVAPSVPVAGVWTGVMAEFFATMADANRLLGRIGDDDDQHPTADGRGKSTPESRARLARMVGRDEDELTDSAWRGVAGWFAEAQLRRIHDGAALVLSAAALPSRAPVVACGVGRAAVEEVARRLGRPVRPFDDLVDWSPDRVDGAEAWAAGCAPAVAVAILAGQRRPEDGETA